MSKKMKLTEKITYEAPSWNQIYDFLLELSRRIKRSGFKPDIIIGVARGGWPPARILSDLLENPNIANIKAEFYLDIYKTKEKPRITQPVSTQVKNKQLLVVDDVADSGKSLKLVKEHLLERGASKVKTCTIYYKPWSIITPNYYIKKTKAWVIFPWERRESTRKIGQKLKEKGKTLDEIEDQLTEIGLDQFMVREFLREIFGETD